VGPVAKLVTETIELQMLAMEKYAVATVEEAAVAEQSVVANPLAEVAVEES